MSPGDSKTIRIPPAEAYGDHRKDLVITFSKSQLPQDMNPQVGQRLELTQENDQTVLTTIVGMTDTDLMLDANHPLAGKELTFDLQLGTIE
jgi:FKBP-type peptidyl-prolyl cis-trans isomerase 2